MGYRSDVKLAFYCESGSDNLGKLEAWVNDKLADEMEYAEKFDWSHYEGFVFTWDFVKWYEEYGNVQKVVEAIDEFSDTMVEDGFMYEFVRIGEEDDDIEKRDSNNAAGLLTVRRTIEFS